MKSGARPGVPLALALTLVSAPAAATAVIALRTDQRVVLAADSLRLNNRGERTTGCKIRQAGRWWTSIGGFMGVSGYDAVADVSVVLANVETLQQVHAALVRVIVPRIERSLAGAKGLPGFGAMFEVGGPVAQLFVAGVDHGQPVLGTFMLTLRELDPVSLQAHWLTCPGDLCNAADGRAFHGASVDPSGPAVRYLQAPRPAWVEAANGQAANRIIREQIAGSPDLVGGPIDVIELSRRGARWVDRDERSRCAAIR